LIRRSRCSRVSLSRMQLLRCAGFPRGRASPCPR